MESMTQLGCFLALHARDCSDSHVTHDSRDIDRFFPADSLSDEPAKSRASVTLCDIDRPFPAGSPSDEHLRRARRHAVVAAKSRASVTSTAISRQTRCRTSQRNGAQV
jgi:hypothetical protein